VCFVSNAQDRYVTGDHRFRGGYSKHNPRKMVKAWAEKEYRNLNRLWQCGVRCPRPRMLRNHVLLMEFIGKNGVAAPRLKDAEIDVDAAHVAYLDCVRLMCELLIDTTVLVLIKRSWHNHDCS
jgi:RIO kinase 1